MRGRSDRSELGHGRRRLDGSIRSERRCGDALPGELDLGAPSGGGAHPPPKILVAEHALERGAQPLDVPGRDEQARLLVDDEVEQPPNGGGDNRAAVGHRLRASDAESLAPGGARDAAARS